MLTLGVPITPRADLFASLCDSALRSHRYSNDGPLVRRLEQTLSADFGIPHVLATASGTSAITLALLALDAPAGGEVITSPLTFVATAQAIELAGLTPVFAAVDPETLNLRPDAVAAAITARTVALLPVHLFGVPCDPALDVLASDRGLSIIYDAAHAFGVGARARALAGRGDATCYSLHATKLLTTGEGGLVVTADEGMAARTRSARDFGRQGCAQGRGCNGKLSEFGAALGLASYPAVMAEVEARRRLADAYDRVLAGSRVRPHQDRADDGLITYAVRCRPDEQECLIERLAAAGVAARRFSALCAPSSYLAAARLAGTTREAMTELAHTVIALPFHSSVTDDHIAAIASSLTH